MLLLRSASRACLRAFLLASVAVITIGISSSYASNFVTMTFTGQSQTYVVNTSSNGPETAGKFNWTFNSQSGGTLIGAANGPVTTFCIELSQTIGYSQYTYRIEPNISTLPLPGGGIGSKANAIQALANFYALGTNAAFTTQMLTGITGGDIAFVNARVGAVLQAVIWELSKENSGTFATNGGTFSYPGLSGAIDTAVTNILNWLNNVSNIAANTGASQQYFALGLTSDQGIPGNQQDQIVFVTASEFGGNGGVFVPVPAGLVMAGMGVVCLGGFNFLRRRKTIAVA